MENLQRGRSASESRSGRFASRPNSRHPSREGSRDRTRASSRERRIAEMKPVQFDHPFDGERFESTKRYDPDSSDDSNWDAVLSKNNGQFKFYFEPLMTSS